MPDLDSYVDDLVDSAPDLTPRQVDRLRLVLNRDPEPVVAA